MKADAMRMLIKTYLHMSNQLNERRYLGNNWATIRQLQAIIRLIVSPLSTFFSYLSYMMLGLIEMSFKTYVLVMHLLHQSVSFATASSVTLMSSKFVFNAILRTRVRVSATSYNLLVNKESLVYLKSELVTNFYSICYWTSDAFTRHIFLILPILLFDVLVQFIN